MFHSHVNASIGLFWLLLGLVEEDKISVKDPAFSLTSAFGRLLLMTYVVCTVIVALNMLIAMMNNSFDRIMVSLINRPGACYVAYTTAGQGMVFGLSVLNGVYNFMIVYPKQDLNSVVLNRM